MSVYSTSRSIAATQIESYGTSLSLQKPSVTEYDPQVSNVVEILATAVSFYAIISSPGGMSPDKISSTFSLEEGDLLLTIAEGQLSIDIEPRDVVTLDSGTWRVIAVDPPFSGEQVVVRQVQIRKETS